MQATKKGVPEEDATFLPFFLKIEPFCMQTAFTIWYQRNIFITYVSPGVVACTDRAGVSMFV
jgi:hypothetical protein